MSAVDDPAPRSAWPDRLWARTRAIALQLADTADDVAAVFERLAECRAELARNTPGDRTGLDAGARRAREFAEWERREAARLRGDVRPG